jgi:FkbM family methyltransferase
MAWNETKKPNKSQSGQDMWVHSMCEYKENGYFIDVGAHLPRFLSNTYYLEYLFGWTGLLIEPNPYNVKLLEKERTSTVVPFGVSDKAETLPFKTNKNWDGGFNPGIKITKRTRMLPLVTFNAILKQYNAPREIDYINLDCEGYEVKALNTFPWSAHNVKCWTIEHNLYEDSYQKPEGEKLYVKGKYGTAAKQRKQEINDIMTANGYLRWKEDVTCNIPGFKGVPFEDWYVNIDVYNKMTTFEIEKMKNADLDFASWLKSLA